MTISRARMESRRLVISTVAVSAVLITVTWAVGNAVLNSPFRDSPKVEYVAPDVHRYILLAWLISVAQVLALLWVRRFPRLVVVFCSALALLHVADLAKIQTLATHPYGWVPLLPSDLSVAVAIFVTTVTYGLRQAAPAIASGTLVAVVAADRAADPQGWTSLLLLVSVVVVAWIAGDATRSRQASLKALQDRAATEVRGRAQAVELAASNERARITREIHDSVAHGLSVIVIQAQAASAELHRDPASSQEALEAIVSTGRIALSEMRASLGLVPSGDSTPATPGQDLAIQQRLDALLTQVRATGLQVDARIEGGLDGLPPDVETALYRIVQESLTNTMKHAGSAASSQVTVCRNTEGLDICVQDVGSPTRNLSYEDGQGLRGMKARVAALAGHLDAGPRPEGGYLVRVHLPLHDSFR